MGNDGHIAVSVLNGFNIIKKIILNVLMDCIYHNAIVFKRKPGVPKEQ